MPGSLKASSRVGRHYRPMTTALPRILVVDDNDESRGSLVDAFAGEGFEVTAARNGLEALDLLGWNLRPACVVVDMCMPVMNGWEFRRALADSSWRDVPVIGVTGGTWKDRDATDFPERMRKPIDMKALLAVVKRVSVP